jgi:hypothetical protein
MSGLESVNNEIEKENLINVHVLTKRSAGPMSLKEASLIMKMCRFLLNV